METRMKEDGLSIALSDQLVLESGVEVDKVPGVLPGVEHHLLG